MPVKTQELWSGVSREIGASSTTKMMKILTRVPQFSQQDDILNVVDVIQSLVSRDAGGKLYFV